MIIVRVIFVETTRPVRMRPRIETSPVNGHFLSVLLVRSRESHVHNEHTPIYCPLMASKGVLNPRPTSLNHLLFRVETFFPAMCCKLSHLLVRRGFKLTLGLGVLEKVLLLIGLFNLWIRYQHSVRDCFNEYSPARTWRWSGDINENSGGEGADADGLGLSHNELYNSRDLP